MTMATSQQMSISKIQNPEELKLVIFVQIFEFYLVPSPFKQCIIDKELNEFPDNSPICYFSLFFNMLCFRST